jgi:4-hydroxy-tetrahydrodipicolinate synthase
MTVPIELLEGYVTALPTPFRCGSVDYRAFAMFADWQISQGARGLVVCGTTGEAPTLTAVEQMRLIRQAVAVARARVPVIAGAGSNSTSHAIALARAAERHGADALLSVVPYYNRPSQEGLYQHFRAIHDAVSTPLLLYDVPTRTGCTLEIETICRLAELPRMAGLKDASADMSRPARLRSLLGPRFRLFAGDDSTALTFIEQGGDGCISVTANVAPRLCGRLYDALKMGEPWQGGMNTAGLSGLTASLFVETNPVPLKYALYRLGWMSDAVRLPLCPAEPTTRQGISAALTRLGRGERSVWRSQTASTAA